MNPIINMVEPPRENPQFDKESIERTCLQYLFDGLAVFEKSPISIGDEGIYIRYAGRIFLLSADITLEKEITDQSEIPEQLK